MTDTPPAPLPDPVTAELEAMALVARAAADKALREVLSATQKPATVLEFAGNIATVHIDGDPPEVTVPAESLISPAPYANARVMVQFHPPHAVFVAGWISRPDPAGEIKWFGRTTAPDGFLLCDGAAVSRAEYPALFEAIGTTFGAGDGNLTFNLPDGRGRSAVGAGGVYAVGATGGADSVTLTTAQIPGHIHDLPAHSHSMLDHTHDLPFHSHGIGSHSHSMNDHTHDLPFHSHGIGSHSHSFSGSTGTSGFHSHSEEGSSAVAEIAQGGATYDVKTLRQNTGGAGDHSHSVSGSVGSTSLSTGSTDPGATGGASTASTGAASLSTGSTDPGITGGSSTGSTGSTDPGATGGVGGGGSHENRSPFIAFLCCISF